MHCKNMFHWNLDQVGDSTNNTLSCILWANWLHFALVFCILYSVWPSDSISSALFFAFLSAVEYSRNWKISALFIWFIRKLSGDEETFCFSSSQIELHSLLNRIIDLCMGFNQLITWYIDFDSLKNVWGFFLFGVFVLLSISFMKMLSMEHHGPFNGCT